MCIHLIARELDRLEAQLDQLLVALETPSYEFYRGSIAGASSIVSIVSGSIKHYHGASCSECMGAMLQ